MARLGQVLREAREKKGCSWREIEAATGLWPEYVQALERENPGRFTSAGHFRSALRLYARYLGLDVREVLSLWERAAARPGRDRGEPPARGTGVAYRTAVAALVISLSMAICGITGLYGYRWPWEALMAICSAFGQVALLRWLRPLSFRRPPPIRPSAARLCLAM
jgi:cytoskeletal protein RodZ